MIEITSFRQGAIVNHHHGVETEHSLTVPISGVSSGGFPVKVNGIPAHMEGRNFTANVELTQKLNPVEATVLTPYGEYSQKLTLVWDKKSFRRGNFYIDDHSFTFRELSIQRPKHAFDHFYLKALKEIHRDFGLKVTLNCFYHDDHHDWELKHMPDTWKDEFRDNSDWLRFSFHSYSEFPDRPYLEATPEQMGHDFDLVRDEIIRFAGEESFIAPIVLHWANIHPAVAQELVRRGVRCYSYALRPRVMGGPSLSDRQKGGAMDTIQKRALSGEDKLASTEGLALHYDIPGEASYFANHEAYYDPNIKLFFFARCFACCNLTPLETIPQLFAKKLAQMERTGDDICGAGSHEQYSFPDYPNYIPDHLERLREATRCMVEVGGCKPIFFSEGLMGNTAWGD